MLPSSITRADQSNYERNKYVDLFQTPLSNPRSSHPTRHLLRCVVFGNATAQLLTRMIQRGQ